MRNLLISFALLALCLSPAVWGSPASLGGAAPELSHGAASAFGIEPALAQMPTATGSESIGWVLAAVAAAVAAIGTILAFLRRESGMQKPEAHRHVTGGPLTVREELQHVERHEHQSFRIAMEKQQGELWEVINGMRRSISRIEADFAGLRAAREANGDRIGELGADVKQLSHLVHELVGVMKQKGGRV